MPLYTQGGHRFCGMPYSTFYWVGVVSLPLIAAVVHFMPSKQAASFSREPKLVADTRQPNALETFVAQRAAASAAASQGARVV